MKLPITEDVNLIYKVAVKFYIEGRSQVEIAQSENLSRATICRLLRIARDMDMVHIDVTMPKVQPPSPRMAEELANALGISKSSWRPWSWAKRARRPFSARRPPPPPRTCPG